MLRRFRAALASLALVAVPLALGACSDEGSAEGSENGSDDRDRASSASSSAGTDDAWLDTDVCALEIPADVLAAVAGDPANIVAEPDTTFADSAACEFDSAEPPNGVEVRLVPPSTVDGDPRELSDGSGAIVFLESIEGGSCILLVPAEPAWVHVGVIGVADDPCAAADDVAVSVIDQVRFTPTT